MSTSSSDGRRVVAHYRGGRLLKGTTNDFAPGKLECHVFENGDERSRAVAVSLSDLKALFFVKSYQGDKHHVEKKSFKPGPAPGRKVSVTFHDGETILGHTMGYDPKKQGFFLVPVDPDSNNARVYVLNVAIARLEWITERPAAVARA